MIWKVHKPNLIQNRKKWKMYHFKKKFKFILKWISDEPVIFTSEKCTFYPQIMLLTCANQSN